MQQPLVSEAVRPSSKYSWPLLPGGVNFIKLLERGRILWYVELAKRGTCRALVVIQVFVPELS